MAWFNSKASEELDEVREWLTDTVVDYTCLLEDCIKEIPTCFDKEHGLERLRKWAADHSWEESGKEEEEEEREKESKSESEEEKNSEDE